MEKIHHDDYAQPITAADMDEAKERIIRERGTHLDSMMEKLEEPRVRRIVEPVMLGETLPPEVTEDDVSYCLDLGLLKKEAGVLSPANPIYSETIVREMALGSGRLDLGVHFHSAVYAVEVKTADGYARSHEKANQQVLRYMDRLGVAEGWLVVADSDLSKPWDEKISSEDIPIDGKTVHLIRC